ncbi:MAG: hypothetical protein KJ737_22430 [Proteobacteria bacterium]|nr:hypothetical protein [Pseudomonadota bacterium]
MKTGIKVFFFIAILTCMPAFSGQEVEIILNDGTRIEGEIMYYAEGVYEIKSSDRGMQKIHDNTIFSVKRLAPESQKEIAGDKVITTSDEDKLNQIMENSIGEEKILKIHEYIKE